MTIDAFADSLASRLDRDKQAAQQQAGGALLEASGTNPDSYAKAIKTGEALGIPPASAAADPSFAFQADLAKRIEALGKAPKTQAFLADPDVAKVAQDDILHMAGIEDMMVQGPGDYQNVDLMMKPVDYAQSIGGGAVGGAGGALSGLGNLWESVSHLPTRAIRSAGFDGAADFLSQPILPWWATPSEILKRPGGVLKDSAESMKPAKDRRGLDTDIAEGVGQLVQQMTVALMSGGLTSATSLATMFGQGADQQAERADKAGAAPADKDLAVIAGAGITAITEKYGLEALLNKVPQAVKGGVLKALADISVAGGKEAAQEVVEGVLQNLTALALYDPNAKIFEGWERDASAAFGSAAIVRGILQAVVKGKSIRNQSAQANQAEADGRFMDRLAQGAVDSKLAARSADVFERFIGMQAQDGQITDVYLPADKVREYAQSAAEDPAFKLTDDPLLSLPSVQAQLAEAAAGGHDIVIPIGEYVANVARSDLHQILKPDIRVRFDGMSMREAVDHREKFDDLMAATATDAQAEVSRAAEESAPAVQVYDDIFSKLRQAGYGVDASRRYAAVIAARYDTRGARLGSDAWTQYQRMPISIEAVAPESLRKMAVNPQVDSLIEAARRGIKAPAAGKLFGRSLSEFIAARGGVIDQGGELTDMGADKVKHRGLGPVVRAGDTKTGDMLGGSDNPNTLDNVALAAFEAGYFPELQGERPTPDQLIEALREELAGKPRYAEGQVDTSDSDWANSAADLRDTLDSMGHDITAMTNDQVKEVMVQARQAGENHQAVGREFGQAMAEVAAKIRSVIAVARKDKTSKAKERLFSVPRWLAAVAKDKAGLDLDGYDVSVDAFSVRHTINNHGDEKTEAARGNVAVSDQDIEAFPLVTLDPDRVVLGVKDKRGQDQIFFVKTMEDGSTLVATEVRTGGRDVTLSSVRRYPERTNIDTIVSALIHNVQNALSGVGPIVVNRDELVNYPKDRGFDQAAYHGSPHIFDKFSLDHIGSGEGNQSYGWGLYFAGAKQVAKFYREALTKRRSASLSDEMDSVTIGGQPILERFDVEAIREFVNFAQDGDNIGAASFAQSRAERWAYLAADEAYPFPDYAKSHAEAWRGVISALEDGEEIRSKAQGRLYHVELAPHDDEYLLWDEPLSAQSDGVKERLQAFVDGAVKKAGGNHLLAPGHIQSLKSIIEDAPEMTGRQIYHDLSGQLSEKAGRINDRAASLALRDAGIPGIKYLDGSSRSAGEGNHNYVLFDDSLVSIREYEQTKRGAISFQNGQALIRIFKDRDLSTMLHETSHLWLEEMVQDAAMLDAPQQIRDDLQKVLDWFGVEFNAKAGDFNPAELLALIQTDHHEMFARAGEAYFMEGKAPSTALQSAFESFKAWMIRIYRTIAGLNVQINDDIRGVFDRLIATDQQIADMRERQRLTQAFSDAAQMGATAAEFAAYEKAVAEARDLGQTTLLKKVMGEVRMRREAEWRDEAAAVRDEVEDIISQSPIWRAMNFLRKGTAPEGSPLAAFGKVKLNRDAIVAMYGQEQVLKLLPWGAYQNEGGISPHDLAPLVGYESASDMLQAMMNMEAERKAAKEAGDNRSRFKAQVDGEVDSIMAERHGDMLNDGSIEQEAIDAIHNEKQGGVLAAELKALHRQAGRVRHQGQTWNVGPLTTFEIASEWARRTIAGKRVGEVATPAAINAYLRAEAKAGKAAQEAILAGDHAEAYRQKQRQLLNHAFFREAKRVGAEVDRDVKMLSKMASKRTIDGMDQDYLDQIHGLLERYDFRKVGESALQKRDALAAFVAAKEAEGQAVVIPAKLLRETQQVNYRRVSVDDLAELADAVRNLAHLGRLKQELLDGVEKRKMDDLVAEAVTQTMEMKRLGVSINRNPDWKDRLGDTLRSFDASLLKIEQVIDWLDGGKVNGVFSRIVMTPIREAQAKANDMQMEVTKTVVEAFGRLTDAQRKSLEDEHRVPEFGGRLMKKSEILAIALNTGNESNLDKMVRGEKLVGPHEVGAVLQRHMTAADWRLVQDIWDTIETLWPEISAQHKRLTGLDLPKVESRSFEAATVDGEKVSLRGGYYPVVYDPRRSPDVEANMQRSDVGLFENIFSRPATTKGHTIERVEGYARPLLLDLKVIPDHLAQVIHRLAFEETLIQADKFLADPRIRYIISGDGVYDNGVMGTDVYKTFRPWLQAIANDKAADARGPANPWERFLQGARMHGTMVGMGFRASTMIAQIGGLSASQEYLGGKWVLDGIKAYMRDPSAATEFVWERSGEMRHRANQMDRDLRDSMRQLTGKTDMLSAARRFAFAGIGWMDRHVAVSTWLGAYHKAQGEGMTDTDSIAYADRAVALTQGAGGTKDLAQVQRSSEGMKLMTMFYSYFSVMYARQRNIAHQVAAGEMGFGEAMAKSWWLMVFPAVATDFILGRWPDDEKDETWLGWALSKILSYPMASVPFLRDFASTLASGYGYTMTPAQQMLGNIFKAAKNMKDLAAGEDPKGVIKHTLNAAGFALGLPTGQAATSLQYMADVKSGEAHADNTFEYLWKLVMGGK